MKKPSMLIPLFTICLIACNEPVKGTNNDNVTEVQTSVEQTKEGWKIHDHPAYSISYPNNEWTLDNSGLMGTSVLILKDGAADFRDNINVYIEDLTGKNIVLDKYIELSKKQIGQYITDYKSLESKRLNINGDECQMIVYNGVQGVFSLQWKQYYYIKDQKAYVVTYTRKQDHLSDNTDDGGEIMNSFKLK